MQIHTIKERTQIVEFLDKVVEAGEDFFRERPCREHRREQGAQ
jgi:hypothetical protein